jgi:hypothetical protein
MTTTLLSHDELRARAVSYLNDWGLERETCPPADLPLRVALSLDAEHVVAARAMAGYWLAWCLRAPKVDYRGYGTFLYVLTFASTLHLLGDNQSELFHRIAAAAPPPRPDTRAQHKLVQYWVQGGYPDARTKKTNITFKTLPNKVGKAPLESLYRLVMRQRTSTWYDQMQPYFQLITMLHAQRQGVHDASALWPLVERDFLAT